MSYLFDSGHCIFVGFSTLQLSLLLTVVVSLSSLFMLLTLSRVATLTCLYLSRILCSLSLSFACCSSHTAGVILWSQTRSSPIFAAWLPVVLALHISSSFAVADALSLLFLSRANSVFLHPFLPAPGHHAWRWCAHAIIHSWSVTALYIHTYIHTYVHSTEISNSRSALTALKLDYDDHI